MVVGDPLTIYRAASFQPAGSNVFMILQTINYGIDGYIGLQDGATISAIRINISGYSNMGVTKFNIDNTEYYYASDAQYSSTGIQIK
tara:strand:- start:333 stop:593 length:261 start_codon:yes stop_codon:yes gene_type:complete